MLAKVATSRSGSCFARSPGERWVEIWDLTSHDFLAALDTSLDPGGDRFAISPDGSQLLVGAYRRAGLALYQLLDGTVAWRRKDVTRTQVIDLSADGKTAYITRQDAPAFVIDVDTGDTLDHLSDAQAVSTAHGGRRCVVATHRDYYWLNGEGIALRAGQRPGTFLDAACGTGRLYLSEATGLLRVVDLGSSQEIRTIAPPDDSHWVKVSCVGDSDELVMVRYDFGEARVFLDHLSASTGITCQVGELEAGQYSFGANGSLLIGSRGDLRRADNGSLLTRFEWRHP